ncbi:hypothetical protein [Paenibacillus sp. FSL H7-0331]|uniref:hypothetical protein n=1 Tax=Paenibacillus sp. FSL H7-0331 TaxID=1920421 RepID=UPI00096E4DDB|nr:hypothetical protein [Paenibacillus sp. FSL H7-0331]OMF06073.1 hypothetical protein BK127_31535 [Paenibacillus sp. FSL H7-0331]
MNPVIGLAERVETLKKLVTYFYQIAFYILQNENLAIEATRTALIELSMDDEFFSKPLIVQQQILKRTSMNTSIATKHK